MNVELPSILGTPYTGETLTADRGGWTGYPVPSFTYQWQRGGVDIGGETGTTYVVDALDEGENITVEVTATNSEGSAMAESDPVVGLGAAPVVGDAYLLEIGDDLLLESGDRMLLEAA